MSLTLCSRPMMIESVACYGSASSSRQATTTRLISASIPRHNTSTSASVIYKKVQNEGRKTSPSHSRTCSLPEIPISPSQRSFVSSDTPLLLQTQKVAEKQSDETFVGSFQHQALRNSMFPNFRALHKLSRSAKTRAFGLTQSSKTKSPATLSGKSSSSTMTNSRELVAPLHSVENDQPRLCDHHITCNKSLVDTQVPAGFNSILPGNSVGDREEQNRARSDEMIQVYVADHPVSSKLRKKKTTKKKKRQSRAKSRSQSTHRHSHDAKHPSGSQAPQNRGGPLQDNSIGSLLLTVPVVVEPKKVEIYSSRYNKCDSENKKTVKPNKEEKDYNMKIINSFNKISSETIGSKLLETVEHDPVMYGSRVSPRIPGVGGGLHAGHHRGRDDVSKVTKVFLSEKQSGNLRELGCILPCAPPGTPTPQMLQNYQYIPSMTDLRSQRTVRERLSGMEEKVKKKVQQQRDEARKTEQQLQRDQAVALKQRQRLEIYALNKVMTEFEWMNFKEFMKNMDGKSP
ncbi:uncharacterized protein LOC117302165 [Asterias rubens]|uniref:uncharacterized protein LOC117302165 n=1 Tax=Asterias rubens TaxID=7604 RepID=UPI0014557A9A|nr:uncharacterized protein LOC117302165 [Asterias rubens]